MFNKTKAFSGFSVDECRQMFTSTAADLSRRPVRTAYPPA